MPEYLLPDVGEGLTEAELVAWKVKVGDVIEINDIVCEIETAKSIVELPSPYAGTVGALLVQEGETIAVGTPIIAIGDDAAPSAGGRPVTGGSLNSRSSHALASFQSRITVSAEMPSTAADSSTLRPPNHRSSTT